MKKKPDLSFNKYDLRINGKDIRKKIGTSGVYVFRVNKTAIYVGATYNMSYRATRIFFNKNVGSNFLNAIIKSLTPKRFYVDCYFYELKDLLMQEKRHFNRLRPISQSLITYRPYKIPS